MNKNIVICDRCGNEIKHERKLEITIKEGFTMDLCEECKLDFESFLKAEKEDLF